MKRSIMDILKEAVTLFIEDVKKQKWAILIIGLYFIVVKQFTYSLCPMVTVTGFPCPACGLSRAGFSLLRGRFLLAFEIHPFIYPIAALVIMFFLYRYILHRDVRLLKKYLIILIVCMIVYFVYRMIRYFPGEPPMSYYSRNYIKSILDIIR